MKEIENTLKNLKVPAPDPEARLRAKRAALAEFERAQAANQGLLVRPRPSRDDTSHGSFFMFWNKHRGLFAGAAGVCVVALGAALVLPTLNKEATRLGEPEVATSTVSEAPRPAPPPEQAAATPEAESELGQRAFGAKFDAARSEEEGRRQLARPASPPPPPAAQVLEKDQKAREIELSNVTVTGARGDLAASVEGKKEAAVVDSISSQDIGKFPDKSVGESLQRVAGATVAGSAPAPAVTAGNSPMAGAVGGFYQDEGRDQFKHFDINPIKRVSEEWVSTFSADVDTASYSFVRGRLNEGQLPQKDAVRTEEMVNYFDYAWPAARSRSVPFQPTVVVSDSPWNKGRKLVHIGIKGYTIDREEAPDANLVLLLDVSASMNHPAKLPLAVRSMEMLLDSLKPTDTVAIVVYAGAAGTVLEPTPVRQKDRILDALRSLRPGGSTAGAEGIERAYELAERSYRKGGVNRILLATDGDFNVGISNTEELKSFVERKREKGVYLSVLGFGQGNYRDELAQALAQNGNGVAAYIDTENEARKVLVQEASGSLFTIAKDVKLQVEFNPVTVSEYRLVGYETRSLRREDFNNDAVDAGDVGAGHTVTAIYEITPVGVAGAVDESRYAANRVKEEQKEGQRAEAPRGTSSEYGFLKIRYKLPSENTSRLLSEPILVKQPSVAPAVARDVSFSTAVAGFAQLLRGGQFTGSLSYEDVLRQAQESRGDDRNGYRAEFLELVRKAGGLNRR